MDAATYLRLADGTFVWDRASVSGGVRPNYQLERKLPAEQNSAYQVIATEIDANHINILPYDIPDNTYDFRLKSVYGGVVTDWQTTLQDAVLPSLPTAMIKRLVIIGAGAVTLTPGSPDSGWPDITWDIAYVADRTTDTEFIVASEDLDGSVDISGLSDTPGFRVRARSGDVIGDWSNIISHFNLNDRAGQLDSFGGNYMDDTDRFNLIWHPGGDYARLNRRGYYPTASSRGGGANLSNGDLSATVNNYRNQYRFKGTESMTAIYFDLRGANKMFGFPMIASHFLGARTITPDNTPTPASLSSASSITAPSVVYIPPPVSVTPASLGSASSITAPSSSHTIPSYSLTPDSLTSSSSITAPTEIDHTEPSALNPVDPQSLSSIQAPSLTHTPPTHDVLPDNLLSTSSVTSPQSSATPPTTSITPSDLVSSSNISAPSVSGEAPSTALTPDDLESISSLLIPVYDYVTPMIPLVSPITELTGIDTDIALVGIDTDIDLSTA